MTEPDFRRSVHGLRQNHMPVVCLVYFQRVVEQIETGEDGMVVASVVSDFRRIEIIESVGSAEKQKPGPGFQSCILIKLAALQPVGFPIAHHGKSFPGRVFTRCDFTKSVQRGSPYHSLVVLQQGRDGIVGQSVGLGQHRGLLVARVKHQDAVFRPEPFHAVTVFQHAEIFGVGIPLFFQKSRNPHAVFLCVVIVDAAVAQSGERMAVHRIEGMNHGV